MNDRLRPHVDKRIRKGKAIPAHMLRPMVRVLPYCKLYKVRDTPFTAAVRGWIKQVVGSRKASRREEFKPNEDDRIVLKIRNTQVKRHTERVRRTDNSGHVQRSRQRAQRKMESKRRAKSRTGR